jgi:cation diffusion facilitator family transporter
MLNAVNDSGEHAHDFDQGHKRPGEMRTIVVAIVTAIAMCVEIVAGIVFGSMALLADGLHMGSHAVALGIAVFAYIYARRHAYDARFNFGTGKVNALGGFTGAVLLALFAVVMAWESTHRLFAPVPIAFNQAILVAIAGLLVNGISMKILAHANHSHAHHGHDHHHADHHHHHHHDDHNLRSAYLHVFADALTSVFAIVALLAGKYFGWLWLDPFMGIVGAIMVAIWSKGLLRDTARVLLDMRVSEAIQTSVREHLEHDQKTKVTDLHIWSIGPNLHAAAITLTTSMPPDEKDYHELLPKDLGIVHATIEVQSYTTPHLHAK